MLQAIAEGTKIAACEVVAQPESAERRARPEFGDKWASKRVEIQLRSVAAKKSKLRSVECCHALPLMCSHAEPYFGWVLARHFSRLEPLELVAFLKVC